MWRVSYNLLFVMLVFVSGLWMLADAEDGTYPKDQSLFVTLTLLLFIYLMWEVRRVFNKVKWNVLLVPPVFASFFTFFLQFGSPNFSFIGDGEKFLHDGTLGIYPFYWMNLAMVYVLVAAFAMWRGYHARLGATIGQKFRKFLTKKRLIRKSFILHWPLIFALIVISIAARFLQVRLGIYGYSAEMTQLHEMAAYKQIIDLAVGGGRIALIGIALVYFSGSYKNSSGIKVLFMGLLALEMIFALLSGFKGQFVLPLVTVGLCFYVVKKRIPLAWILASVFAIIFAYQVIEPFRVIRNTDPSFENKNMVAIFSVMTDIAFGDNDKIYKSSEEKKLLETIMSRGGATEWAARSIAFKEEVGLNDTAPNFLSNLFLSPMLAFVPRLIWTSKPISNIGYWFNTQVMGRPLTNTTSVGMSSIGYLYFAGGVLAIVGGFFVIGILQKILYQAFFQLGSGGWIIFFGMLTSVGMISSDVSGVLASTFRFLPILIFIQYFLFKPEDTTKNKPRFQMRSKAKLS